MKIWWGAAGVHTGGRTQDVQTQREGRFLGVSDRMKSTNADILIIIQTNTHITDLNLHSGRKKLLSKKDTEACFISDWKPVNTPLIPVQLSSQRQNSPQAVPSPSVMSRPLPSRRTGVSNPRPAYQTWPFQTKVWPTTIFYSSWKWLHLLLVIFYSFAFPICHFQTPEKTSTNGNGSRQKETKHKECSPSSLFQVVLIFNIF